MADRRLSRAVWSTKDTAKPYTRPTDHRGQSNFLTVPGLGSTVEEESEDEHYNEGYSGSTPNKIKRITSRPHRIDNNKHGRRFSVYSAKPPNIPLGNVPALPNNAEQMIKDSARTTGGKNASLFDLLSSPDYDAAQYLNDHLKNADASRIDDFTSKLADLTIRSKNDVKSTISESLESVLNVSDSVADTYKVLNNLKQTINALNDVLYQQLDDAQDAVRAENETRNSGSGYSSRNSRNRKNADKRRSVLILEKKWASDMSQLFKEVDGAQQFVSAASGRHVVTQSKRWGELNALTWKPVRPAHLIILNDYLLVATRKRIEDKKRTIATGCWPLRSVTLIDSVQPPKLHTEVSSKFTLAFKTANASLLFQTDSQNEYNKVKTAFNTAKSDRAQMDESEEVKNWQIRKSINRISSDHIGRNSSVLHDLSSQLSHHRVRSRDYQQQSESDSLDSVDENLTNIEMLLGHHKFEECTGFVNRLKDQLESLRKSSKATGMDKEGHFKILIKLKELKLDDLINQLVGWLSWKVSNPIASSQDISDTINLFRMLGLKDKGRKVLLDAKTKQLNERVGAVKFEGDLKNFLMQVSIIYFNFIQQVYVLYVKCFTEVRDKSFAIDWTSDRIKSYNEVVQRQLIDYKKDSNTYKECVRITRSQAQPLRDLGLNVDYLFDF